MDYQIYFFSTTFLLLCGVFLSYDSFGSYIKLDKIVTKKFIAHKVISIIVGTITLIFGVILLVGSLEIVLIGDIIPAFLAIIGGVSLLSSKTSIEYQGQNKFLVWIQEFIKTNTAIVGLLMIVFGFLHAVFPQLILL